MWTDTETEVSQNLVVLELSTSIFGGSLSEWLRGIDRKDEEKQIYRDGECLQRKRKLDRQIARQIYAQTDTWLGKQIHGRMYG